VMGFEESSKWMKVMSINPGYTEKDVRENCGFELTWADHLESTEPPLDEELRVLREEVDPLRYIIGKG
jgi:glutaconate CoA-transferase subunit B